MLAVRETNLAACKNSRPNLEKPVANIITYGSRVTKNFVQNFVQKILIFLPFHLISSENLKTFDEVMKNSNVILIKSKYVCI